jgi:hypothetical protein
MKFENDPSDRAAYSPTEAVSVTRILIGPNSLATAHFVRRALTKHPSSTQLREKLATETPALLISFDLLVGATATRAALVFHSMGWNICSINRFL